MQDLITHDDFYARDELFYDGYVCATRSHTNITQRDPQPYHKNGIYVWLDGEFSNRNEISSQIQGAANSDPEILCTLFKDSRDFSFLKQIDGIFSAVIYDSVGQKIYLVIDRYGLRHLYWTVHKHSLVWASEVKAMLALPDFQPRIDPLAVKEFFGAGFLLEDRSWFEGVELLSPGTIFTWDIQKQSARKDRYWWWDQIKPLTGMIDERDIAEELGRLFSDAVERRCGEGERVGMMLSGGLDSRAVLAAMPDREDLIHVLTFGRKRCGDIRIATMAAKTKGAIHHAFEINSDNWLMPRVAGVWWTDGQLDLMHMHGIEAREVTKSLFEISISGFAGDAILGGSHLMDRSFFDVVASRESVARFMHCDPSLLQRFDDYKDLAKTDFYFLQNKVRKFTFGGLKYCLTAVECRMPFYDNKLIEFTYSLPDALRYLSKIYKSTLLRRFPDFYRTIPWHRTGYPISWPHKAVRVFQLSRGVRSSVLRGFSHFGLHWEDAWSYSDYPNWLRQEPSRSFCWDLLTNRYALYANYISEEQVYHTLLKHLEGEDHSKKLCRYLTFEIWLQQVFKKKHRR